MTVTRRTLLASAGAASLTGLLASCAGLTGQQQGGSKADTLTFTAWGTDQEVAAYKSLIAKFEAAHKGVTVKPNFVPYAQMFTNIDAQLSAGNAPDVFRVGYTQVAGYAAQDQLLDLSDALSSEERAAFTPAFLTAVTYKDKPFGVPQQADTSAIVYNKKALETAGVGAVPDRVDDAWSYDELRGVLTKLRGSLKSSQFPFAYNWQIGGSFRWLSFVFASGGRLLDDALTKSAIESPQGTRALDFTREFFEKKFVPANDSTKSNTYADTDFPDVTAMVVANQSVLGEFEAKKVDWGVTYLPQDVRGAAELSGNALVATKAGKQTDLAVEFLKFMVQEDSMRSFCRSALELPTLESIADADLHWKAPTGVIPAYAAQATKVTAQDAEQVSVPAFAQINTVLTNELEAAFRQGRSTADTLRAIATGVDGAIA